MRFLLDTNALSEPLRLRPDVALVERLERHASEVALASVVWHEAVFGAARMPEGRRRTRIEAYLYGPVVGRFPVLPYDHGAATWHAMERARLAAAGRTTAYADGQIAAIAATNGLILVTANVRDFAMFEGVEVVDWTA